MRIAVITWPTLGNDYSTHVIAGNNKTDEQLSKMAYRWAAMGLSARAYKACTIALFTADLTNPIAVKDME
jgi:hypothetical protein